MKKVSVIMPCFNDGQYIEESIESVLNQTYKNIELIIIDDGSTDNRTLQILDSIDNDQIKVLKFNKMGVAAARNKGIDICTGEYILPLDSDDIIEKTYIEKAVRIIEQDQNIGIVYCEAEFFDGKTGHWNLPEYSIESMLVDNVIFVTSMFRKKDWKLVSGFDESFKYGIEDYDFWLSIIELGRDVVKIPEILFKYRIKKTSRNKSFIDNVDNVKWTYKKIYTKHNKLYSMYKDEYAIALREYAIDQNFKNIYITNKFKKIPILGFLLNNKNLKDKIKKFLFK